MGGGGGRGHILNCLISYENRKNVWSVLKIATISIFFFCNLRHENPLKTHPERISKADRRIISRLDYDDIKFAVSKKDYVKIEKKNSIWIYVFCYENGLLYPVQVTDKMSKYFIDSSLVTNKNKSSNVYIKGFYRFMCNKTKNKNKKHFCRHCFQCFSSNRVLMQHKEVF